MPSVFLRPLFVITVLVGSFLLFLIQPMFARMVMPRLGGSSSVWLVAMLFYQAVLLGGYLYAHALQRLALRRQMVVHLALFGVAGLTLPVATATWVPDAGAWPPALSLLALLVVSIGPVFLVVSAQAPLMQAWFARSDDPAAGAPYFLYAASNAGSLAALFAYPLLIEPAARLATQGWAWSAGFAGLLLLVALAGWAALRRPGVAIGAPRGAVTGRQRLRWTLLALVPSGLLLSTTAHLTTDIMAIPLLWVIPLAVYLLSFIIAFGPGGAGATRIAVGAAPVLLLLLGGSTFFTVSAAVVFYAASGVVLLFVVALALHGTLAAERPAAGNLTDYYLWISVGGALGGVVCALLAPLLFDWGYEHPLLLIAAALLLPARPVAAWAERLWTGRAGTAMRWVLPVAALAASLAGASWMGQQTDASLMAMIFIMLAALVSIGRAAWFAWALLMLMMTLGGWKHFDPAYAPVERTRSFFGIYTVSDSQSRRVRELQHGTTLHGVQSLDADTATRPTSYYAPGSGVGRVFAAAPVLFGPQARMAFVGLGSGTLACYAQAGQRWTAFEIDPAMVAIARDRRLFSYVERCTPDLRIIVGDARLMLAREPAASVDMLAVDAFSSDAIPLHLMTAEAFRVYARALSADGVLLIHISNRYLDLEPVVAAMARSEGWSARIRRFVPATADVPGQADSMSVWIALTRSPARMGQVIAATGDAPADWARLRERPGMQPWTDDFASILPALKPL
ncbi:spermidine synthase [Polymorphobacter sp.]|uniref:spermidine synthase n=1 Tax=Polymorphobacter sp. TaxID=1909290 RepID=UPI003F6FE8BD